MGGTQNGIRSRPSSIAAWLDLVVALSCSSLWQGILRGGEDIEDIWGLVRTASVRGRVGQFLGQLDSCRL